MKEFPGPLREYIQRLEAAARTALREPDNRAAAAELAELVADTGKLQRLASGYLALTADIYSEITSDG
ncbi:MAG TPA: hypothetical protein VKY62_10590 [Devosia sp.]|nr:hypothetical protein [Devosia sp.]